MRDRSSRTWLPEKWASDCHSYWLKTVVFRYSLCASGKTIFWHSNVWHDDMNGELTLVGHYSWELWKVDLTLGNCRRCLSTTKQRVSRFGETLGHLEGES